jgi:hypothetical protein
MGPSSIFSPEEGEDGIAGELELALGGLQPDARELSARPLEPGDLPDDQPRLALGHELAHPGHTVRGCAELVAAVQEGDGGRDGLEVQEPVEGTVAATGDQQVPALEIRHAAHGIEERGALERVGARQGDAARHEAAGPGGDDDVGRLEDRARAGDEAPVAVIEAGQLFCLLVEVVDRGEGLCLLDQPVDQLLAGAAGHGRDVEDRLFRIKLGALPADLVEIVDEVAFEAQEPGLEHSEEANRASADDHHVRLDDAMIGRGRDDGSFGHCCPPDGLWACGSLAMPVSASTAPVSRQVCWPQEGAGRRAAASGEAAEEGPGRAAQPSWSSAGKKVVRRFRAGGLAGGVAGEGHPPVVAVQAGDSVVHCRHTDRRLTDDRLRVVRPRPGSGLGHVPCFRVPAAGPRDRPATVPRQASVPGGRDGRGPNRRP